MGGRGAGATERERWNLEWIYGVGSGTDEAGSGIDESNEDTREIERVRGEELEVMYVVELILEQVELGGGGQEGMREGHVELGRWEHVEMKGKKKDERNRWNFGS